MSELTLRETSIPGLLILGLEVHSDRRGWFKENWQRTKMTALGLPNFRPVQQNIVHNGPRGVTRGVHAEPWDKFVAVAKGRVFGAWVDLRQGPTFGRTVSLEMGPETAAFVPRGVGNSYQVLEDQTVYSYLVNDHWSATTRAGYTFVNLADEALAIDWPIPLEQAIISDADLGHPRLKDTLPVAPRRALILGADGQLGRAMLAALPDAIGLGRAEADLTDPRWLDRVDLSEVATIVNAGAYTAVDAAESPEGRREAWATNATGVAHLVRACNERHIILVHVSSDYVFDGTVETHIEDEPFTPLGVYGQSKAAGDAAVSTCDRHYLIRTTWVVGDGNNFVSTMSNLADRGVSPRVVSDQFGRLTFTDELAAGISHLLTTEAPFGTYNLSNSGPVQSWADIAADIFELKGRNRAEITPVSSESYFGNTAMAPRPRHSTLDLSRIIAAGFEPTTAADRLASFIRSLHTAAESSAVRATMAKE